MKKLIFTALVGVLAFASAGASEMKIILKSAAGEARATLNESAAAKSLYAQLPLTLAFRDYAGHEKIATPPRPLDTAGAPKGSGAKAGEIAYFAPWNNLVLYYGEQEYYPRIVILGRFEDDYRALIKESEITVQKVE